MSDKPAPPANSPEGQLRQLDWGEIREAGSYLHIASGLIARVYAEDVAGPEPRAARAGGGPFVCLIANPNAPIELLREIATRHGFRVTA